jgi:translation initiation factor 4G
LLLRDHGSYDRDFLLQFMSVCKEKPDSLPPLDAIGLEPADQGHAMYRGGSGRRTSNAMPPLSRQASVGLGIGGFGKSGFNAMGQFGTGNTAKTSDERFRASSGQHTPTSSKFQPASMSRTNSASGRSRGPRGNDPKGRRDKPGSGFAPPPQMLVGPDGQPLGPVKPLEKTADAWMPQAQQRKGKEEDDSPAIVDRKVKALLNKLTMEKFDSISDQIIAWANKSESQRDGRTLIQVIRLVFEKATDEAAWSEMYARLCRKMMEQISPDVQDESIKNPEGKPIAGGQLFRKYLLNRCQEDFERGWASKEAAAAAAKAKEGDDAAVTAANADKAEDDEEIKVFSEEYYASQKAKRQGLGLVKFIGELFKLQMLTERIMHECVKKLLGNVDNPEEEDIESLCKLLTTVGKLLDTQRAGPHMDIYFARMRELSRNPKVNSRMQYMLLVRSFLSLVHSMMLIMIVGTH